MNTLVSVRTNIFYVKKKDEYIRFKELIFMVDKPTYRYSNEGETIRERGLDEFRLNVSDNTFEELIKILVQLRGLEESGLE